MRCTAYLIAVPVAWSYGEGMGHDVRDVLAQMEGANQGWACHLGISFREEAPEMGDGDRLASACRICVADPGSIGLKVEHHDGAERGRRACDLYEFGDGQRSAAAVACRSMLG